MNLIQLGANVGNDHVQKFIENFNDYLANIILVEPAGEAVPKSEPVNDVAVKDPEISTVFAAKSPFISGVPEPEAIYNLLLSLVAVEGPAPNPIAMLFEELPENKHPALFPIAVLLHPVVLLNKAPAPKAVLLPPVVVPCIE